MNTIENVKKKDELVQIEKEETFIISTSRVSSQFERIEIKTVIRENTSVVSDIERVMHCADFASDRKQDRDKKRNKERESDRERREREQTTMSKSEKT